MPVDLGPFGVLIAGNNVEVRKHVGAVHLKGAVLISRFERKTAGNANAPEGAAAPLPSPFCTDSYPSRNHRPTTGVVLSFLNQQKRRAHSPKAGPR